MATFTFGFWSLQRSFFCKMSNLAVKEVGGIFVIEKENLRKSLAKIKGRGEDGN